MRCDADVRQITVADGRATGVRLAGGEHVAADIVVSNADSAWTYRTLLAPEHRRRWTDKRIARARSSMGLFVWYFGTNRRYDDVAHHTMLLGPRYRALLRDIFKRHRLAEDFSLYLHRPTATDPSLAPPGCDAFYVLSPVPHLASGTDWAVEGERYRRPSPRALEATVLPGLQTSVVTSRIMTPQDFQDRLLSFRGAAFGMEPLLTQSAWFRPHNAARRWTASTSSAPAPIPAPGCPACCARPRSSTRWCPMPSDADAFAADLRACRDALRGGSRTFFAASRVLPRRVSGPATALYAFCRVADDLIDEVRAARRRRRRTLAALHGGWTASTPAARAPPGRPRARRRGGPASPAAHLLDALLEGFAWDAAGRRYETLAELQDYAARVAGTVGAMMAVLMGARTPALVARACDLGVPCSSPTSPATWARTRGPAGSTCRSPGCARPASTRRPSCARPRSPPPSAPSCDGCLPPRTACMPAPTAASRGCPGIAAPASAPPACSMPRSAPRSPATATTASRAAPSSPPAARCGCSARPCSPPCCPAGRRRRAACTPARHLVQLPPCRRVVPAAQLRRPPGLAVRPVCPPGET